MASPTPSTSSAPAPIIDSLPYYDNDLEIYPELKEKVDKLIAAEVARGGGPKHELGSEVDVFEKHPLLKAELQRVQEHRELRALDDTRYQMPAPSRTGTDEDWQAALKNAKAQLEHQRLRLSNIALLQTYGANAWKIHNRNLEHDAKTLEAQLEEMKERSVALNRERKQSQTEVGKKLTAYETRWTELISNVFQLELANFALETDIAQLKEREKELQSV